MAQTPQMAEKPQMVQLPQIAQTRSVRPVRGYYNGVSRECTARCGVLAIALCAIVSASSAHARGQGTRAVVATPPAPEPESVSTLDPRWTLALDSPPAAEPAFDTDTAFVATRAGTMAAVDLDSGTVRWRVDLVTPVSPAVGEGRVFVAGDGVLLGLDAATGQRLWEAPLPGRVAAPLYWDAGWLLASNDAGDLAAFRAEDGAFAWRQPLGAPLAVAPVPALDRVYLALNDGRLVSADLATGTVRWTQPLEGRVSGLLALDDQLIVGTTGNVVLSVDLVTGRVRWRWRVGADVVGGGAADDRHIYFVALDNVLRAVSRRNGNLRWTRPLPSRPGSGPVLIDEAVLVPFVSNEIAAFVPADGKPLFTIRGIGELGADPHLRANPLPTRARIITINREGTMTGLAPRFEPPPAPFATLPGVAVGGVN